MSLEYVGSGNVLSRGNQKHSVTMYWFAASTSRDRVAVSDSLLLLPLTPQHQDSGAGAPSNACCPDNSSDHVHTWRTVGKKKIISNSPRVVAHRSPGRLGSPDTCCTHEYQHHTRRRQKSHLLINMTGSHGVRLGQRQEAEFVELIGRRVGHSWDPRRPPFGPRLLLLGPVPPGLLRTGPCPVFVWTMRRGPFLLPSRQDRRSVGRG